MTTFELLHQLVLLYPINEYYCTVGTALGHVQITEGTARVHIVHISPRRRKFTGHILFLRTDLRV